MADQVTNYKCPACTGPLHYVGSSGKLECDYCGSKYDIAEIEAIYQKDEQETVESMGGWDASELTEDWGEDAEGMRSYSCPSCGAELICDAVTAATSCPYCGNPTIVPGQFAGGLKPDYIIPFKLDQKAAEKALTAYYKNKRLLPKVFSDQNKVKEIKGVYVPFWLFDGSVDADISFDAARSRVFLQGDFEVTQIQHYDVQRAGTVPFEKIPVDASKKMPDDYMDSIEPYDYRELKPFSTAYLPGYLADIHDVTVEESASRAETRAKRTAEEMIASDVGGYSTCRVKHKSLSVKRGKVSYGLLPVYMLSTKWNGKNYLFAMNGQTGKMVGNLPIDKKRYWAWFCGIAGAVTLIFGTIGWMLIR